MVAKELLEKYSKTPPVLIHFHSGLLMLRLPQMVFKFTSGHWMLQFRSRNDCLWKVECIMKNLSLFTYMFELKHFVCFQFSFQLKSNHVDIHFIYKMPKTVSFDISLNCIYSELIINLNHYSPSLTLSNALLINPHFPTSSATTRFREKWINGKITIICIINLMCITCGQRGCLSKCKAS